MKNILLVYNVFEKIALIIILVVVCSNIPNVLFFFHKDTKYYTYSELPKDLRYITDELRLKLESRGIDSLIIKKTIYVIYQDSRTSHGGFGFNGVPVIGLKIVPQMNYYNKKEVIWHEFGHIVMGYGHEDSKNHIMNYATKLNFHNQRELEESFLEEEVSYFNLRTMWKSFVHHNRKLFNF